MKYFVVRYLIEDKNGFFVYLPVTNQMTTDRSVAEKWFDNAVNYIKQRDFGLKLKVVRENTSLPPTCTLKGATFSCEEAAFLTGEYMVVLEVYSHIPTGFICID